MQCPREPPPGHAVASQVTRAACARRLGLLERLERLSIGSTFRTSIHSMRKRDVDALLDVLRGLSLLPRWQPRVRASRAEAAEGDVGCSDVLGAGPMVAIACATACSPIQESPGRPEWTAGERARRRPGWRPRRLDCPSFARWRGRPASPRVCQCAPTPRFHSPSGDGRSRLEGLRTPPQSRIPPPPRPSSAGDPAPSARPRSGCG